MACVRCGGFFCGFGVLCWDCRTGLFPEFTYDSEDVEDDDDEASMQREDSASACRSSSSSQARCRRCGETFRGFGDTCGECRRLGSSGAFSTCESCGGFFCGFGTHCWQCRVGMLPQAPRLSRLGLQAHRRSSTEDFPYGNRGSGMQRLSELSLSQPKLAEVSTRSSIRRSRASTAGTVGETIQEHPSFSSASGRKSRRNGADQRQTPDREKFSSAPAKASRLPRIQSEVSAWEELPEAHQEKERHVLGDIAEAAEEALLSPAGGGANALLHGGGQGELPERTPSAAAGGELSGEQAEGPEEEGSPKAQPEALAPAVPELLPEALPSPGAPLSDSLRLTLLEMIAAARENGKLEEATRSLEIIALRRARGEEEEKEEEEAAPPLEVEAGGL